jgi:hypothetical protein
MKKLEDLLDLPPMESSQTEEPDVPAVTKEEALEEAAGILTALSNSEKVDLALTSVTGLVEHDNEMDDIATKALQSFKDLNDLGQNISDLHAGKIYEVAASMLKTAMDAKDAKVNKKLKMIDLQLKKLKLDRDTIAPTGSGDIDDGDGQEFDRNDLLKHIIDVKNLENSDK